MAQWGGWYVPQDVPVSHIYLTFFVHTGIGSGAAVGYVRSANSSPETLRSRRIRAALDVIHILALLVLACHDFLTRYMSTF
jgi:hypothetical protein